MAYYGETRKTIWETGAEHASDARRALPKSHRLIHMVDQHPGAPLKQAFGIDLIDTLRTPLTRDLRDALIIIHT